MDEYGKAQDFFLTPGDTLQLEYKFQLDGSEHTVGTFTIQSSEKCAVVYTPVDPKRFKMMRSSSLEYYRHAVVHAAKKNGGQLNLEELESVFDKEVFYNKLRYESE